MDKRFQRTTEEFDCGQCGRHVVGDGYTNHCPGCLWSRHVDIQPGDRLATCGGWMEPVAIELDHGRTMIVQRCETCGFERRNRSAAADDFEAILAVSKRQQG
jgi:hypothetical protein